MEKPELSKFMNAETFSSYYYLKEELVAFCKELGLPTSGNKQELTKRIAYFLETGCCLQPSKRVIKKAIHEDLYLTTLIEPNIICSEKHRTFFKQHIGSSFTFCVTFQKWLKHHAGKTYADVIAAYHQLLQDKSTQDSKIGEQFAYNAYIRAYFADHKNGRLQDAIACWNYKKQLKGKPVYEREDEIAVGIHNSH